jgi:hypothetical protein
MFGLEDFISNMNKRLDVMEKSVKRIVELLEKIDKNLTPEKARDFRKTGQP